MITTFREAQCLLMLYQACPDEAIRERALRLVPELAEFADTLTFATNGPARRRKLTAYDGERELGQRFVICRDEDIEEYKRDYALGFDLVRMVRVYSEDA